MDIKLKNILIKKQRGFSLPELMIVVLIISILVVLALPQVMSSRRLFRFSGLQRQVTSSLTEARQEAMSQRKPITVLYDDTTKRIILHGGKFGDSGDAQNRIVELTGSGLGPDEIAYGRPGGATTAALADTSNITPLTGNAATIIYQADGSVIDTATQSPKNSALFFYNVNYEDDMAFAVSVLGAGGRAKIWRYNKTIRKYVE